MNKSSSSSSARPAGSTATISYFHSSFLFTLVGLILAFFIGWHSTTQGANVWQSGLRAVFLCAVLGVLEVSLSFDNAVVNAATLKNMTPAWRHRFLTWGMIIAVFGMRLVFPLAIVGVMAHIGPWQTILMAAQDPVRYAEMMQSVRIPVAAFGGSFLLMVALRYFFDIYKQVHWIRLIEEPLTKLGRLSAIELAVAMSTLYIFSTFLPEAEMRRFIVAGMFGLIIFILVDGLSSFLEHEMPTSNEKTKKKSNLDLHRASAGMFLYLEILDASFSFDGVVGAFAVSENLFIITIGLGIGAMFVRSLTVLLVDRGTLTQYLYVEHGAFYAIGALAVVMFLNTILEIPEVVTGLTGAGLILLAFWSSVIHNRRHPERLHIGELPESK